VGRAALAGVAEAGEGPEEVSEKDAEKALFGG
jgi:hypothetical protein